MKKFLLLGSVMACMLTSAQYKFLSTPALETADLQSERSEKFANTPAEILYRSVHFHIDYSGRMEQNIVSRIKVYNKNNAAKYLDREIALYDDRKGSRETLANLKAVTYNWEDGKEVKTKISKQDKYKSKEDKNYDITKFAFANVKDGSVVEYSYTIITPFLGSTPRVLIEDALPARYVEYVLDAPTPLGYTINYKGSISPNNRIVEEKLIGGKEYKTYRFGYNFVPAYREEEYVRNNDNYKTGIKAELNSTYINNVFKSYATTWEDVRKRLYEHENFGGELKKENLVKKILPEEMKTLPIFKKAEAILKFVQDNYTWNKEDAVIADKGVRNLLAAKEGNSAEINLLLTMLLRSAGISAEPVVLSTVSHGRLLTYNPSIMQLNYVLSSFEDNGKLYLLDGAYKFSKINMIAPKALNYDGLLVTAKAVKQVNIVCPTVSETVFTVDANLTHKGTFEGTASDLDTNLYAMVINDRFSDNADQFAKEYKDSYRFSVTNLNHGLKSNGDFESNFNFASDTFVDMIGNKMVFNPLLFLHKKSHDFKQEGERKAPIEFYSAHNRRKKVTITLPDDYVFENIPKPKKFRTEDNSLQYTYMVSQQGNKLTVETTVEVDDAVFPQEYYPAFTQIFDNIVQQEGQVVTAVKKL